MDPQRPLSYLSAKSIFRYFSLKKRRSLSKKCSSTQIRRWNRTFPFRFNKVVISYDYVEIDNIKWTFKYDHKFNPKDSADEEANRNCPTKKFTADEKIPLAVTIPSGKKFFFENEEPFQRLIDHYVNRKGNKIRLLEIHKFWKNMQDFVDVKVDNLTLDRNAVWYRELRERFMNNFENNKFNQVWISIGYWEDDPLVNQLKNMNIKSLQLNFREMTDPKIQELNFEQIAFVERDDFNLPTSDGLLFLERITPYIARSFNKRFDYLMHFKNSSIFDPKVIVNLIKKRWGAEHKYHNYEGMLVFDINDKWHVLIKCFHLGQWSPENEYCYFDSVALLATIMEKRDVQLVPASKLSIYGRILRGMNIWQYSVTEFMKKSYRLDSLCYGHRRCRECVFFLNTYHLRTITFLIFFGFYSLVFSVLSMLGFPLGAPLSFLASLVLAGIVNYVFLLPYKYDCRTPAIWDIAAE